MNDRQPVAPPEILIWRRRTIDQSISMHAALRDRAVRISTAITLTLLCSGAISAALAFAGTDTVLQLVGIDLTKSVWLGIFSIVVFMGSLIELVTDHRGVARQHGAAVRLLADLKSQYHQAEPDAHGEWADTVNALTARDSEVMTQIPAIPESRFNTLKARHLRKVEVSKILSASPGLSERQARRRLRKSLRNTPQVAGGSPEAPAK